MKQMRDDATIHKIFDKKDESDKEDQADKNSDDEGMADDHAAILRLQTIANPQLLEELKAVQEGGDPNAIKSAEGIAE